MLVPPDAADQKVLLRVDFLELQDVVIVVGPDDDQVPQEVAAVLLHHPDERLVKIALDVEHESAPLGVGHGGIVVVVEAGEGVKQRVNDGGGLAGADRAEGNDVRKQGLLVERHAPEG